MRCHYEVLEIERSASSDELKRQYKKLALKWHPDKNVGNEELATETFKQISAAYTVLSDPQERKWYDDHRESILKGKRSEDDDGNQDDEEPTVNVWAYFNSGCFTGYKDDDPQGFYSIYQTVFESIYKVEVETGQLRDSHFPLFGNSLSTSDEVLSFYSFWTDFVSQLSFAWSDKYNPNEAPSRPVRRIMEKENKKFRDFSRKKYQDAVRALVRFVKKLDKRVVKIEQERAARKDEEEKKKTKEKAEQLQQKKALKELKMKQLEEDEEEIARRLEERKTAYLLAESSENDEDKEEVAFDDKFFEEGGDRNGIAGEENVSEQVGGGVGTKEDQDSDDNNEIVEETLLRCDICNKDFKSPPQLAHHLSSKAHRAVLKAQSSSNAKKGAKRKPQVSNKSTSSETPSQEQGGTVPGIAIEDGQEYGAKKGAVDNDADDDASDTSYDGNNSIINSTSTGTTTSSKLISSKSKKQQKKSKKKKGQELEQQQVLDLEQDQELSSDDEKTISKPISSSDTDNVFNKMLEKLSLTETELENSEDTSRSSKNSNNKSNNKNKSKNQINSNSSDRNKSIDPLTTTSMPPAAISIPISNKETSETSQRRDKSFTQKYRKNQINNNNNNNNNTRVDTEEEEVRNSKNSIDSNSTTGYNCRKCTWKGETRNQLFEHLSVTGHSTAMLPDEDEEEVGDVQSSINKRKSSTKGRKKQPIIIR